jgi:hypothetical protein
LSAPNDVEEVSDEERPEHIAEREGEQIKAGLLRSHPVKAHQHQRIGEEDGIVEKGLR